MSSRRLFLAIHLSEELRSRLVRVQESLEAHARAVRLVAPQNLHLTLHFLGDTDEGMVEPILDGMRDSLSRVDPFDTRARGGGCFPSARKPWVFWAGVDGAAGALSNLHGALGASLEELGFELDRRPFSPHVTIGYARKRAERSELSLALGDLTSAAEAHLGRDGTRFPVTGVSLVESVLGRQGPSYSDLGRVEL
jgi:2'-5' RNA ligase